MQNKILIYDEGCPLCAAYTAAFVKTGLLSDKGRKNFSNVDSNTFSLVDNSRCRNEIPLIDTGTNQVWYGIDALLEIISPKAPLIKFIGNRKPVKWLLVKCYKFISYNRKVIVATSTKSKFNSSPDFSTTYRSAFLFVFLIFNTLLLNPLFHYVLNKNSFVSSTQAQFQYAHAILVSGNIVIALFLGKKNGFEYLGQINMLALTCLLLLSPLMLLNKYYLSGSFINNTYLGMVAICTFAEYIRRMKYANVVQQLPVLVIINVLSVIAFMTYLAW